MKNLMTWTIPRFLSVILPLLPTCINSVRSSSKRCCFEDKSINSVRSSSKRCCFEDGGIGMVYVSHPCLLYRGCVGAVYRIWSAFRVIVTEESTDFSVTMTVFALETPFGCIVTEKTPCFCGTMLERRQRWPKTAEMTNNLWKLLPIYGEPQSITGNHIQSRWATFNHGEPHSITVSHIQSLGATFNHPNVPSNLRETTCSRKKSSTILAILRTIG